MDLKKFKKIVGPTVKKIKKENQLKAVGSFHPLAHLLLQWYEAKVSQEKSNENEK